MKKRFSAAGKRLREQKGESIAEVLVALLISAVALVMLASMINASARLVTDSRKKMAKYYAANEFLTKQVPVESISDDDQEKDLKQITKTGKVIIQDSAYLDYSMDVRYQVNPLDDQIIAYWKSST